MTVRFAPNATLVTGNSGGAVQSLPDMAVGGNVRVWIEKITLATQVSGDSIMVARIPYGSYLKAMWLSTDTSLSTSTLSVGDANSATRYGAATTYTATNTSTEMLNVAAKGAKITTAYDNGGTASTAYTDILLTIGTANLPASGNLVIQTEYVDYGS